METGLRLAAPSLLPYELSNAVWLAERRGRIDSTQADQILQAVDGLDIEILAVDWTEVMRFALNWNGYCGLEIIRAKSELKFLHLTFQHSYIHLPSV